MIVLDQLTDTIVRDTADEICRVARTRVILERGYYDKFPVNFIQLYQSHNLLSGPWPPQI
jgi:hypothetical protein